MDDLDIWSIVIMGLMFFWLMVFAVPMGSLWAVLWLFSGHYAWIEPTFGLYVGAVPGIILTLWVVVQKVRLR